MDTIPLLQTTDSGTTYALLPPRAGRPAPALLLLAMAAADTLTTEPYCRVGRLLHAQGWAVVSLDLPCHGADLRPVEPAELAGWAARTAAGEDIVASFCAQADDVAGHLVAAGIANPAQFAAAGTSRGGFMAFHAACNPRARARICAVAAFAPVTDVRLLSEFAGQQDSPLAGRLALENAAGALAGCAAWITIGHADARVGTGQAVAFARALQADRRSCQAPAVVLRVLPTPGHSSYPEWHDEAAGWLSQTVTVTPLPARSQ